MKKLITFAVPCYNSEEYVEDCVNSLLVNDNAIEILLINDGSTDKTRQIIDRIAKEHPEIVRAIHQKNAGHGGAVNTGLREAKGKYFKVVDSDDKLDSEALLETLEAIRERPSIDLFVCNYVYCRTDNGKTHRMNFHGAMPVHKEFTWDEMRRFKVTQYLPMHSAIYRTQVLRDCKLELPEHTFYVDNVFVYLPLQHVKTLYYLDNDLYLYSIGRPDQSVNEENMIKRVDQQLRVTDILSECADLEELRAESPKLARYLRQYLAMMFLISTVFLCLDWGNNGKRKHESMWNHLRECSEDTYRRLRWRSVATVSLIPGAFGRRIVITGYRICQKIFKFN